MTAPTIKQLAAVDNELAEWHRRREQAVNFIVRCWAEIDTCNEKIDGLLLDRAALQDDGR